MTQDEADYFQSIGISSLNGIVSVLIILAKRGLISDAELSAVHDSLSKPLSMQQNSGNKLVMDAQQNLDLLIGEVARYLRRGPLPPSND